MHKKMLSLVAVFAIMFTMLVPAQAAAGTNATITVEGTGQTFYAYRLLEADSVLKDASCHTDASQHTSECYNIAYSLNSKYTEAITAGLNQVYVFDPVLTADRVTVAQLETWLGDLNADSMQKFATTVATYINKQNISPDATAVNKVFSNVPQGYYLILEGAPAAGDTVSKAILDTNGATGLTVTLKEDGAVPVVTLSTERSYGRNKRDEIDLAIGETGKFIAAASIPNDVGNGLYNPTYSSYDSYSMTFNLNLENMTLEEEWLRAVGAESSYITPKVWVIARTEAVAGNDGVHVFDITAMASMSDNTISTGDLFAIPDSIKNSTAPTIVDWVKEHNTSNGLLYTTDVTLKSNGWFPLSVVVTYSATLNDTAKIGTENPNTQVVTVSYPASAYDPSVLATTTPASCDVLSYGVKVNMVTGADHDPVTGAEYKLMYLELPADVPESLSDTQAWNDYISGLLSDESLWKDTGYPMVKNADGSSISFNGLGIRNVPSMASPDGTQFRGQSANIYKLVQTRTPSGYNHASDIMFFIDPQHSETGYKGALTSITKDVTFTEMAVKGTWETTILNVGGAFMPSTGGSGTMMLYVGGGVLMLLAAAAFVMKKKNTAQ